MTKYHAVTEGLKRAKERHGNDISYCGFAQSWDECLTWFHGASGKIKALFQYNVGKDTYAVLVTE